MADFDSDIQRVVNVKRTYQVYRGTSPTTQSRFEVSTVWKPIPSSNKSYIYCFMCDMYVALKF